MALHGMTMEFLHPISENNAVPTRAEYRSGCHRPGGFSLFNLNDIPNFAKDSDRALNGLTRPSSRNLGRSENV